MNRRPSILVIFFTAFLDFVGFGIIMQFLPLYSRDFGASYLTVGIIFSIYSAMQFIFSPILGRLSDRVGRRPVLLLSTAGACVSYVVFALASGMANQVAALWLIFFSRMFAGSCAGNVTVAQAYIADITPAEKRSKMMGVIGMAIGFGFVFGPAIGGISLAAFGLTGPGWIAAALSAANFFLAYSILAESRRPDSEPVRQRPHLEQWIHTLTRSRVGLLVVIFFLATFCFSCFEVTLALLVQDNFQLDLVQAGKLAAVLFVYCGLISAFVQGGAVGRLVKRFGEPKLIMASLVVTGVALAVMPFMKGTPNFSWSILFHAAGWPWIKLLIALALLAIGTGLARPPIFGMISNLTPANEQGATIGVAQACGSLARIVGPIFAAVLYSTQSMPHWLGTEVGSLGALFRQNGVLPYLICGALAIFTGLLSLPRLIKLHRNAPVPSREAPASPSATTA